MLLNIYWWSTCPLLDTRLFYSNFCLLITFILNVGNGVFCPQQIVLTIEEGLIFSVFLELLILPSLHEYYLRLPYCQTRCSRGCLTNSLIIHWVSEHFPKISSITFTLKPFGGGLFYDSKYHFQHLLRYCTFKASPWLSGPANTSGVDLRYEIIFFKLKRKCEKLIFFRRSWQNEDIFF